MSLLLFLTILATVINGFLAGGSLDVSLVKLPTRRRIGNIAYANFARGNDLGNGKIIYPVWAISAALLVFVTTIVAYVSKQPAEQLTPLTIASLTSILHFAMTFKAAPIMLGLKNTPNDEALLKSKLDQFERWHTIRMIFQVITALVMVWALVVVSSQLP